MKPREEYLNRPLSPFDIEEIISHPVFQDGSVAFFRLGLEPRYYSYRCASCMKDELQEEQFLKAIARGTDTVHLVSQSDYDHNDADCSGCDRDLVEFEASEYAFTLPERELEDPSPERDLGQTEDGNEIWYQCPICKQTERFRANFVGAYDMDGAGCWDLWSKESNVELAEGIYEFMACQECCFAGSHAAFRGEVDVFTVTHNYWGKSVEDGRIRMCDQHLISQLFVEIPKKAAPDLMVELTRKAFSAAHKMTPIAEWSMSRVTGLRMTDKCVYLVDRESFLPLFELRSEYSPSVRECSDCGFILDDERKDCPECGCEQWAEYKGMQGRLANPGDLIMTLSEVRVTLAAADDRPLYVTRREGRLAAAPVRIPRNVDIIDLINITNKAAKESAVNLNAPDVWYSVDKHGRECITLTEAPTGKPLCILD